MEYSTNLTDWNFDLDPLQSLKHQKNIHSDKRQQNLLSLYTKFTSFRIMPRTLKSLFYGKKCLQRSSILLFRTYSTDNYADIYRPVPDWTFNLRVKSLKSNSHR